MYKPAEMAEMAGIGGVRSLASRWRVEADLRTVTALHLGGADDGADVDLPVLRDGVSGAPLLTGASLAGAMREYLCLCRLGDRTVEGAKSPVTRLFGGVREDAAGMQSAAIVFDAVGGEAMPEIRDGLAIDSKKAVAAKAAKYDYEVWSPGLRFRIRVDVLVARDEPHEAALVAMLARALEGFADGEIRLGMKTRRGLGVCAVDGVRARRYGLATGEQWLAWLATGLDPQARLDGPPAAARQAMVVAWPEGGAEVQAQLTVPDAESPVLAVEIPVSFPSGILIGAPQRGRSGADVSHQTSGKQPVVTGTSLAGALRKRALRIARACVADEADADAYVNELFGSPQVRTDSDPRASRLATDEVLIDGGQSLEITRIHIDRFTQAPVAGGLLQEQPQFGGGAVLRLHVRLPDDPARANALRGLTMLLVKDLMLGDVALGGTTGVGRGRLRCAGAVRVQDRDHRLSINPEGPSDAATIERIDGWVRAFNGAQEARG